MTETLTLTEYATWTVAYSQDVTREVLSRAFKAAELGSLDTDRLLRAIEYIETGVAEDKFREYNTTVRTCDCPDNTYRRLKVGPCKHRIAKMLLVRMTELQAEQLTALNPDGK